ncbi:CBN-NAS-31 protein [Aphelenchoides avenae]|nr:CBN-NAS-31 protein [Aphelenchus avenae]
MFNVIALAAIVGCAVLASKLSDEEIRQKFLADHAEKPGFKYLKKKALDAQKKQTVQRKKTSGPQVSPDVKKYVEELQAKAIKQRGPESLQQINKPLANFLYQGDMLLTQAQAVLENFTDAGKQRRAGPVAKFNDGSTMERPKWPHDSPICYKFQPGSDPWTKELMRKAAQYWTENTCLTWKEGCTGKPTVMIHTNGDGCYTTPGRGFGQVSISTRGSQRTYSPVFDDEQEMSLASPGCDWLATTLHEASHVMGQAHEQSRPDRDDAIDVIWDNIDADWKAQYAKADGSQVYDIPYDYQSNMQYTGYANDPKVDMAAKERIYQHTMGSRTGVVFNDLKFLNIYNDCMCKSGASCQNGGFPHPRKCNECICPDGFGGTTCTERQQGEGDAPSGCGATVNANSNWQSLEVSVPAPKGVGPYDGTPDSKIANDLQFESHTPGSINECRNDCVYGGTDVKFNDITRGGARICCPEPVQEFGTVTSTSDLMIVRVCSIRNSQKSMIKFRTTDTQGPPGKPVPPRAGVAPSPPSGDGSPPVVGGGGVGGGGSCVDAIGAQKCAQFKEICGDSDPVSQKQMKTICAKTCNLCGGSSEVGGSGGSGGCNDSDAICAIAKRNPSACDGPALGEMFKSSCPCTCPSG